MINAGIIGLGKMGLSHCAIINAHQEFNLIAICDMSTIVLDMMNKYTGIKCYSDYKKMIEENKLDCVFVSTPTKFHAEMVLYALEHGLHVFCEKPLSLNTTLGKEMMLTAVKKGLINQVGYHNRFIGTFNYFKALIEKKAIGDIYHFVGEAYGPVVVKRKGSTWRSDAAEGGGCLYDYSSHVINLIEYILGNIKHTDGTHLKKIYSKDVEDAVYSSLILENGVSGYLSVNWSDETYRKMSTQITVMGSEGKIISDAQEIKIYLKQENPQLELEKGWNIKYLTELSENVDFYLRGEEYSAQIDYFAKAINDKKLNNRSSFEAALHTDEIIEQLKISDKK